MMQKINALNVLRFLLFACKSVQKKLWAKRGSRIKVCYLISSTVYCVIFLIQITDFACQQHIGVKIDEKNKTKKLRHISLS